MEVIRSDFGDTSDVRCTNSARNTGIAKCRFVNKKCKEGDAEELLYSVELEQSKLGLHLLNNLFDLTVKGCTITPPKDFDFVYNNLQVEVFNNSKNNLSRQLTFLASANQLTPSVWQQEAQRKQLEEYTKTLDSEQATRNIIDSNNLVTIYSNIARSYDEGSAEFEKYQKLAKSYERNSVLTFNQALHGLLSDDATAQGNSIKVSSDLGAYFKNVSTIESLKTQIISNCDNCNKSELSKGIDGLVSNAQLNNSAIRALQTISAAKSIQR